VRRPTGSIATLRGEDKLLVRAGPPFTLCAEDLLPAKENGRAAAQSMLASVKACRHAAQIVARMTARRQRGRMSTLVSVDQDAN